MAARTRVGRREVSRERQGFGVLLLIVSTAGVLVVGVSEFRGGNDGLGLLAVAVAFGWLVAAWSGWRR